MSVTVADIGSELPAHDWVVEPEQFRARVQEFSKLPPILCVRFKDFGPDLDKYMQTYRMGVRSSSPGQELFPRPRKRRERNKNRIRTAQEAHDARSRARRRCSLAIKELAPTTMLTLTGRSNIVSRDIAWSALEYFVAQVRRLQPDLETVTVLERHVKGDYHVHVAVNIGRISYNTLRRFWHQALHKALGLPIPSAMLRGADSPGNVVDSRNVKRTAKGAWWRIKDPVKLAEVLAHYLGKYLTKELEREFNRRSYAPSKGIKVKPPCMAYLRALTFRAAVQELLERVGLWDAYCAGRLRPWERDDEVWYCQVPTEVWTP